MEQLQFILESDQIALLGIADSGEFAGQTHFLDNSTIDTRLLG